VAESHTFGGHVSAEDEVAAAEGPMESRAWSGRRAACPDGLVLDESHKKTANSLKKTSRRSKIGRLSTFVLFVF
jgi:hypothetical protein